MDPKLTWGGRAGAEGPNLTTEMTTDERQPTPTAAAPQGVKTELKTMSLSNLSNGQDGGRSKPAPLRKEPGCGRTKPAPMREEPGCFAGE